MKQKQTSFNLFLILMLKIPVFQCKVKTPDEYFFIFHSFMNTFSEAAVADFLQNSCS